MFEELKEQYRKALPEKISGIKELLEQLRTGTPGAEDKLRHIAHTLHGSGSTFGFPDISSAAKAVEHASNEELLKNLTRLIRILMEIAADPGLHRPAILLIDDDKDITDLLSALLQLKCPKHQVVIAATGKEAMQLFDARHFDLIVLDLRLTDIDGRVLLAQLRKSRLQQSTPIIVLSGEDSRQVREECLRMGAADFVTKPFNPDEMTGRIALMIKGETPAVETAEASPAPAQAEGNLPVLIAEDDVLLTNVIKHRLNREGYRVETVADGAAALAALASHRFGLLILDVKMPIKDGFEVLTTLRESLDKQKMPVIMLTAMGSEKDIVRGYTLGANDYMLKPFSPVELMAKVKSLYKKPGQA